MEKSRILLTILVAWILLFVIFVTYKLINAPTICSDNSIIDSVTGERIPTGGCEKEYGQAVEGLLPAFFFWLVLLLALLFLRSKTRK